jgi:putative transposase
MDAGTLESPARASSTNPLIQGLKPGSLAKVKESDLGKVLLADLPRRWTVVSQEWLAEKLAMKLAANVSQHLRRLDVMAAVEKVPENLMFFLEEAHATNS